MLVSELIAELEKLPKDKPIVIEDADTGWYMNFEIIEYVGGVTLTSGYGDDVVDHNIDLTKP